MGGESSNVFRICSVYLVVAHRAKGNRGVVLFCLAEFVAFFLHFFCYSGLAVAESVYTFEKQMRPGYGEGRSIKEVGHTAYFTMTHTRTKAHTHTHTHNFMSTR